ncbi:hypothetical protein [Nostoc piscinale]
MTRTYAKYLSPGTLRLCDTLREAACASTIFRSLCVSPDDD